MKSRETQSGSAHAVIVIVLVVALVLALGWIFWQNFILKDTKQADNQTVVVKQDDSAKKPTNDYVKVGEWDVEFKAPAEGVSYQYAKNSEMPAGIEGYGFTTKDVLALDTDTCSAERAAIGILERSKSKDTAVASPPTALNNEEPIDGYYYYLVSPQQACAEPGATVEAATNQFKDALATLRKSE